MKANLPTIEEVTWDKVRLQVKKIAPDIFETIERLNPDKSYKLYRAHYPYGAMIIGHDGIFNVPYNNQLLRITDTRLPAEIRENLTCISLGIPMSLILNGFVQLFSAEQPNRIQTAGVFSIGVMLALRGLLDAELSYHARRYWNMTSGARTPMMLASLSDQISFNRLKRHFHLSIDKPESQFEHWRLFVEIANHESFPENWQTELLLFSQKWLKPRKDDAWKLFKLALFERSWKISAYPRNIEPVNKIWTKFITSIRNKKATSFVLNMTRYIIEASLGQAVSYTPYDQNSGQGPFDGLTKIIMDVYGLKKCAPIIMVPTYFNQIDLHQTHISIQASDSHWVDAWKNTTDNLIGDTREIKFVLNQFIKQIEQGHIKVNDTPFIKLIDIDYTFYHADKDKYGELLSSIHALDGDPIMEKWRKHPANNELSYRNSFLRSCVKISAKNK
jgi:hypothetical protein